MKNAGYPASSRAAALRPTTWFVGRAQTAVARVRGVVAHQRDDAFSGRGDLSGTQPITLVGPGMPVGLFPGRWLGDYGITAEDVTRFAVASGNETLVLPARASRGPGATVCVYSSHYVAKVLERVELQGMGSTADRAALESAGVPMDPAHPEAFVRWLARQRRPARVGEMARLQEQDPDEQNRRLDGDRLSARTADLIAMATGDPRIGDYRSAELQRLRSYITRYGPSLLLREAFDFENRDPSEAVDLLLAPHHRVRLMEALGDIAHAIAAPDRRYHRARGSDAIGQRLDLAAEPARARALGIAERAGDYWAEVVSDIERIRRLSGVYMRDWRELQVGALLLDRFGLPPGDGPDASASPQPGEPMASAENRLAWSVLATGWLLAARGHPGKAYHPGWFGEVDTRVADLDAWYRAFVRVPSESDPFFIEPELAAAILAVHTRLGALDELNAVDARKMALLPLAAELDRPPPPRFVEEATPTYEFNAHRPAPQLDLDPALFAYREALIRYSIELEQPVFARLVAPPYPGPARDWYMELVRTLPVTAVEPLIDARRSLEVLCLAQRNLPHAQPERVELPPAGWGLASWFMRQTRHDPDLLLPWTLHVMDTSTAHENGVPQGSSLSAPWTHALPGQAPRAKKNGGSRGRAMQ